MASGSTKATPGFIRALHAATRRMTDLASAHRNTSSPTIERALRQAARELLLAQASDWAFLIKNKSAADYATERTKEHLQRFSKLDEQLRPGRSIAIFLANAKRALTSFPISTGATTSKGGIKMTNDE